MKTRSTEYKTYSWGDPALDWDELNEAIEFIATNLRRWGKFEVYAKEKYGEARFSTFFYRFPEHQPGWLVKIIHKYQEWVYKKVFERALAKYPGIAHQLIAGSEYELLRDLLISHQMIAPYLTMECIDGFHELNPCDYHCQHCFINLDELPNEADND